MARGSRRARSCTLGTAPPRPRGSSGCSGSSSWRPGRTSSMWGAARGACGRAARPEAYGSRWPISRSGSSAAPRCGPGPPVWPPTFSTSRSGMARSTSWSRTTCSTTHPRRPTRCASWPGSAIPTGCWSRPRAAGGTSRSWARRTALQWQDPTCARRGCGNRLGLENDHLDDWALTHTTRTVSGKRWCRACHRLKSSGWIVGPMGDDGKHDLYPPVARRAQRTADPP
jgi:hypothetical protein